MAKKQPLYPHIPTKKCQCEQTGCHGPRECPRPAIMKAETTYGTFFMCEECKIHLPTQYINPPQKRKQTEHQYKTAKMMYQGGKYWRLFGSYGSERLARAHSEPGEIVLKTIEYGLPNWEVWYAMQDQDFAKHEYERYMRESRQGR